MSYTITDDRVSSLDSAILPTARVERKVEREHVVQDADLSAMPVTNKKTESCGRALVNIFWGGDPVQVSSSKSERSSTQSAVME